MDQYAIQEERAYQLYLCHYYKEILPLRQYVSGHTKRTKHSPVYGANYTTTCFAFNDPNFNFTYQEYDQLDFRADVIDNNLTAMLAYYVYMIIGYDMDSMSPSGGTEYFKMCQDIVNSAQSLNEKGWKAFEDNKIATP